MGQTEDNSSSEQEEHLVRAEGGGWDDGDALYEG